MAKENQALVKETYNRYLRTRSLINTITLIAFILIVFWQGWQMTFIVIVAGIITIVISTYIGYKHRCPVCNQHLGKYRKKECPKCHIKLR